MWLTVRHKELLWIFLELTRELKNTEEYRKSPQATPNSVDLSETDCFSMNSTAFTASSEYHFVIPFSRAFELSMICVQSLRPHILAKRITHPAELLYLLRLDILQATRPIRQRLKFLGDAPQVYIKVIGEEGPDVGVLVVADQWPGISRGRGVDIDVDRWWHKHVRSPKWLHRRKE